MWTPRPLSHTYAVLDWVLASKTFGLGVGYGHEWNSRLETLKLDSRIRLLTVFKLSSVAHCIGWEPKKINDQPICEHWGSLPHPVPWHCCCAYRPSEPLLAWVVLKKSCPSAGGCVTCQICGLHNTSRFPIQRDKRICNSSGAISDILYPWWKPVNVVSHWVSGDAYIENSENLF